MELLPGPSAGLADPDGGVYDVHARAGVVTIGPVLQIAAWAPVSSAARQGSPPPVIRDLTKKSFENKYLFICFIRAKETVNIKRRLFNSSNSIANRRKFVKMISNFLFT